MEFSGLLSSFSMADLLSWVHNEGRTGSLVVRRTGRAKRILFEAGQVVGCLSDNPAEFYGQHLLNNGFLDEANLFRCLTLCREKQQRLGQILEEEGILSSSIIQQTLRRQVEERICDLFLWRSGVFFYEAEEAPPEEILTRPLDSLALTLEGVRWTDEFRRLSEILPHDDVILERGRSWPGDDLVPLASRIADVIDGDLSLGRLYERVKGSYFLFLDAAYGLVRAGLAEVRDPGSGLGTGSVELCLYDLMFEQAAEEKVLTSDRHVAIPFDVIESYVPIWTTAPSAEEWGRMPTPVHDFYRALDGEKRLHEIFAAEKGRRHREVELLLLQMRRGRLALLPKPLGELEKAAAERKKGNGEHLPEGKKEGWWKKIF